MNINPVDWSRAQDLLLKLLQTLRPLTEQSVPVSYFLNKRFFIPPSNEGFQAFQFRHPVRILTTLHSVQKQVEELIGEVSLEKAVTKPETAKPVVEAKKGAIPSQVSEKTQPLSKQAQRLIDQVQEAIGKLCSSTNIKNPEEARLRESLKHLKPNLDRIIETVTHEGMHSANDGPPPAFRFPLPRSSREEMLMKQISFPDINSPRKPTIIQAEVKRAPTDEPISRQKPEQEALPKTHSKPSETQSSREARPREERGGESQVSKHLQDPKPRTVHLPDETKTTQQKADSNIGAPRITERTSLSAAPFVPETRSLTPPKKKKKRKGFWFREDEADRNNP